MNYFKLFLPLIFGILCPVIVAGQVSLSIPDTTISANKEHEIPIYIDLSETDSVFGFNSTFEFDSDHLEYISYSTEGAISDSVLIALNQRENEIMISFSSIYPIKSGGKLINIIFNPKNESVSTFSNTGFRVNEETPEAGIAEAEINSITSPVTLSISGDTAEVRNNIFLDIELIGLKGRDLNSFEFLLEYQNSTFEFKAFTINVELTESNYVIVPVLLSDSVLSIKGSSTSPISQDLILGEVELFAKEEGEFNVQVIEASINEGAVEVNLEFGSILLTEDKTPPDVPSNVEINFNETTESAVVEITWDIVSASDLKEYLVTREFDSEENTITTELNLATDTLFSSGVYKYFIQSVDNAGNVSERSDSVEIIISTVSNELINSLPNTFTLSQNYPNPFNPTSTIKFGIPEAAVVKLEIYNLLGQKVKTLVNARRSAGFHTVNFDATNLSSGMYMYRIQAGNFVKIKKMTLIK